MVVCHFTNIMKVPQILQRQHYTRSGQKLVEMFLLIVQIKWTFLCSWQKLDVNSEVCLCITSMFYAKPVWVLHCKRTVYLLENCNDRFNFSAGRFNCLGPQDSPWKWALPAILPSDFIRHIHKASDLKKLSRHKLLFQSPLNFCFIQGPWLDFLHIAE